MESNYWDVEMIFRISFGHIAAAPYMQLYLSISQVQAYLHPPPLAASTTNLRLEVANEAGGIST
jgi:hypothetical protein